MSGSVLGEMENTLEPTPVILETNALNSSLIVETSRKIILRYNPSSLDYGMLLPSKMLKCT